jgi:hypothetical protein
METVGAMVRIACAGRHAAGGGLCADCAGLLDYALFRLEKCPFQERKTTCAQCPVHCYKPDPRARMKEVMRYAGPRMLWRHPLLALWHLRQERKGPPRRA